jgi:ribosomal peptide maturation radical SAM protein 1
MPWAAVSEPSLALGILKSALSRERISCRMFCHNIGLLKYLKDETYRAIADIWAVNDFAFAGPLDPDVTRPQFESLLTIAGRAAGSGGEALALAERVLRLRTEVVPRYLAECADAILDYHPTLVGFTCAFDQTIASLCMARALKARQPDLMIALGGYAVHGEVGEQLLRCFPDIDAIARGDGEVTILDLAHASVGTRPLSGVSNAVIRDGTRIVATSAGGDPVVMDEVPAPDYDDFFHDIERLKDDHGIAIEVGVLPLEFSRGCWWGTKHHCVFCGIDDETMRYRHRSAHSAMQLITQTHRRYQISRFRISDYILPNEYHQSLIPTLIAHDRRFELACEIKANLSHAQLQNLARAGFVEIQPGIESFSTEILRLMKKGVTARQNILTLKHSRQVGIRVIFNVLYAVPGEKPSGYSEMARLIPALYHLDAPLSHIPLQFTRYSPMQLGTMEGCPGPSSHEPSYDVVFSERFLQDTKFSLSEYCYYFAPSWRPSDELANWHSMIDVQCGHWQRVQREATASLTWEASGNQVSFLDTRYGTAVNVSYDGDVRELYRLVDDGRHNLQAVYDSELGSRLGQHRIRAALDELVDRRFVVLVDGFPVGVALEAHGPG